MIFLALKGGNVLNNFIGLSVGRRCQINIRSISEAGQIRWNRINMKLVGRLIEDRLTRRRPIDLPSSPTIEPRRKARWGLRQMQAKNPIIQWPPSRAESKRRRSTRREKHIVRQWGYDPINDDEVLDPAERDSDRLIWYRRAHHLFVTTDHVSSGIGRG